MADTDVKAEEAKSPEEEIEQIQLPSRGRFYEPGQLPEGIVRLRPITVKQEKLLAGARDPMAAADKVLAQCLVDCPIAPKDMLNTDRFYLILQLRAMSYGTDYEFKLSCPACSNSYTHKISLPADLKERVADESDTEPFEITLPRCGKKVALRFMRGTDLESVIKYVNQLRPDQRNPENGDPAYEYKLAIQIAAIDGVKMGMIDKLQFVGTLLGADSFAIRNAIAERETGAFMNIAVSCPACGNRSETLLPLTNDFFRSSIS